jgi:L-malate glycosyltransferase
MLRTMDIFVSCSSSEGLSNALLEAMACGCCVIGSRVGGTPEIVRDEFNGLLFESGNAEDLLEKLKRTVCDESLRERLGKNAHEFVTESFDVKRSVKAMEQIYLRHLGHEAV